MKISKHALAQIGKVAHKNVEWKNLKIQDVVDVGSSYVSLSQGVVYWGSNDAAEARRFIKNHLLPS